jgi:hypothetical protein
MSQYPYLDNVGARAELLGFPNILNFGSQFVSAPRVDMFTHHVSQSMILNNPEFNPLFTGYEEKLIDYTLGKVDIEQDCEVITIIPKYPATALKDGLKNMPTFYVIVKNLDDDKLDYFTVDRYYAGNPGFGWMNQFQNRNQVAEKNILAKGTRIVHSPAVQGDMYCRGANLNTIYGSFPETIEDAFILSESAAKKLETTEINKVVLNMRRDRRPLNLYGDDSYEKFLPEIGMTVRDDGLLFAYRPIHWTTIIADTDRRSLKNPFALQDEPFYIPPGSEIIDLTFTGDKFKLNGNTCFDQAIMHMDAHIKCWERIYEVYDKQRRSVSKLRMTDRMHELFRRAMRHMIVAHRHIPLLDARFNQGMKNFDVEGEGGHVVDFLQVEIVYKAPRPAAKGSKLTDSQGAKGVVGAVLPDDWMPVDAFGIRADMWIDMNSPVGRNNPAQLYECGLNRILEFVRRHVKEAYETKGVDVAWDMLMEAYGDINRNYEKRLRETCVTTQDRKNILEDAITDRPKVWVPPFLDTLRPSPDNHWNAVDNMMAWADKWGVKSSPVSYKSLQADGSGKEFVTRETFAIGSKHIFHLHKIPEISAPGFASVNHIGIPIKSTQESKYFSSSAYYPVAQTPNRYGEDELRVAAIDTDVREIVRFQNLLSNSPTGTALYIRTLLLSEQPTNIGRVAISNGDLMESNAVANLLHNITATLGVETKSTLTTGFDIPEEITDAIWVTDISDDKVDPVKGGAGRRQRVRKVIEILEDDPDVEDMTDIEE